ncbi:hypothetical protein LTS17_008575 [Exophiala oligosperma]
MPGSAQRRLTPARNLISGSLAWNKVQISVRDLENRRSLTNAGAKRAAEAVELFNEEPETSKRKTYRGFLHVLLDECGPQGVLSCAIGVGQANLVSMSRVARHWLMQSFKTKRNQWPINSPMLQAFASEFLKDIVPDQARRGRNDDGRPSIPPRPRQMTEYASNEVTEEVFQNASLGGIAQVFDERICASIRRVTTTEDGCKVAVTMTFPNWGLVGCLMSLDIGGPNVHWLASTLFGAKVGSVNGVLQVVHRGATMIVSNPEVTLKGVPGDPPDQIFLPAWRGAVRGSDMSMTILKDGAIVNVALTTDIALEIQQKLYT